VQPRSRAARLTRLTPRQAASRVALSYTQADFASPISEPPPSVASLRLSDAQMAMFIDLGPYVNPSYYVVQEDGGSGGGCVLLCCSLLPVACCLLAAGCALPQHPRASPAEPPLRRLTLIFPPPAAPPGSVPPQRA
jgi:hypothetical protein